MESKIFDFQVVADGQQISLRGWLPTEGPLQSIREEQIWMLLFANRSLRDSLSFFSD